MVKANLKLLKLTGKTKWRLFLCAVLFFLSGFSYTQNSLSSLVQKCDPAVFQVIGEDYSDYSISKGSGFFIDSKGTAITNFHVLENLDTAYIVDANNRVYPIVKVIDYSEEFDLVKVKVDIPSSPYVVLSNIQPLKGQDVFTITYPRAAGTALGSTVSRGIISGFRKIEPVENIQSTAEITHGSSGGGLFDFSGKLVGVTSGSFSMSDDDLHAGQYMIIPA